MRWMAGLILGSAVVRPGRSVTCRCGRAMKRWICGDGTCVGMVSIICVTLNVYTWVTPSPAGTIIRRRPVKLAWPPSTGVVSQSVRSRTVVESGLLRGCCRWVALCAADRVIRVGRRSVDIAGVVVRRQSLAVRWFVRALTRVMLGWI